MTITQTQYDAFAKVRGLRELSISNHMSTTHAQNAILQRLDDDDLAAVAGLLDSNLNTGEVQRMIVQLA